MPNTNKSVEIDEIHAIEHTLELALANIFDLAQIQFDLQNYLRAIEYLDLILHDSPQHLFANNLKARALYSMGEFEKSLPYFELCIQLSPLNSEFWDRYLDVLGHFQNQEVIDQVLQLRDQTFAGESGRNTLLDLETVETQDPEVKGKPNNRRKPDKKMVANFLQTLDSLYAEKKFMELEKIANRAIRDGYYCGFAWRYLGLVFLDQGRLSESETAMQSSLNFMPNDAVAHFNCGLLCAKRGNRDKAEEHYRKAIRFDPAFVSAYNNLGNLLIADRKFDKAELIFRKLQKIAPGLDIVHFNLINVLIQKNSLHVALKEAKIGIQKFPNSANIFNALGSIYFLLKRHNDAIAPLLRALELKPDFADALNNLGAVYFDLNQYELARPYLEKVIDIEPNISASYRCLGVIVRELEHDYERAISYVRKALEKNPNDNIAHDSLLFMLAELDVQSPEELFAEHRLYGERHERQWREKWGGYLNCRDKQKILRIGFVSGDFYNHAVLSFFESILVSLARDVDIRLFAYYNNDIEDEKTKSMMSSFAGWRSINSLNDDIVFNMVREDQIDILVDLSGHTANNRLPLFARKPAPVAATWIGYPGTTGLTAVDYFIADKYYIPAGRFDHLFTEKMAYIPCTSTFLPSENLPDVSTLPALKNGYITFASFNRISKITPKTLKIWAALLRGVEGSKILIGGMPANQDLTSLGASFEGLGISRDRIEFYGRTNMTEYLGLHNRVDICLDTFPYNGGTTIHHGLSMCVPTLSIDGKNIASRSSAAILGQVGLLEFLAADEIDFVKKGLYWSTHLNELADIRANLRSLCAESIKSRPEELAIYLKDAFRWMWVNWCDGNAAKTFDVETL